MQRNIVGLLYAVFIVKVLLNCCCCCCCIPNLASLTSCLSYRIAFCLSLSAVPVIKSSLAVKKSSLSVAQSALPPESAHKK